MIEKKHHKSKKICTVKMCAIGRVKCAIGHEKREFHTMIFLATKGTTKPRKSRKHENHQPMNRFICGFH